MSGELDPHYKNARETAREIITLIKSVEDQGELEEHIVRGVVRGRVPDDTPLRTWLLIEVLARAVASTYDDLADWSASVLQAVANEDES